MPEYIVRETSYHGATKQEVVGELVRCRDCKYQHPPLQAVLDGEVITVTPQRCSRWFGFTDENGWCYKGERKYDEQTD